MDFVALLMVGESLDGTQPVGLGQVGGISLLERQARMALKAGASRVLIVAPALPADLGARMSETGQVTRLQTAEALADELAGEARPLLLMAPGLLIDDRLITTMLAAAERPALAVFSQHPPAAAERLDATSHWAGLALLEPALVATVAKGLGEWELSGTLVRAACEAGAKRLPVDDLPLYVANRRREIPLIWRVPVTEAERAAATGTLLAAAQKGCLDWPARFLHPPVENLLVRLLLPTPITPNMITLATGVLGLVAIWLFATGHLWWALAIVLLVGPLDGVDGKLARTRHEYSKWGDLEHVLDKILEYGWILALAYWFSAAHGIAAWLAGGGIILFALTEAISGEFFRRFSGRQLDDWGSFERRFRLVGGRRNTFFWSLIPFAALGHWWAGFLMILAYAAITFAVSHWRLLKAIGEYGQQVSADVRRNFAGSAYDFLPKREPTAR